MTKAETITELLKILATNSTLSKRSVECANKALNQPENSLDLDRDEKFISLDLDYSGPIHFMASALLQQFLEGRKLSHFLGLTFREFENFSKDANHLPAFGNETAGFTKAFGQIKTDLLIKLLARKSAEYPELIAKTKQEIDLVALNKLVKNGFEAVGLTPISADYSEIYFKKGPHFADFEALEELLGEFYIKITGVQNLKVVAV